MDVTYLDHNASSPLLEELIPELAGFALHSHGNSSSLHQSGRNSRRLILVATDSVARLLNCDSDHIFWTSGASEANSWVLYTAAQNARLQHRPARLLLSSIEHDSIIMAGRALGEVTALRALPSGLVDTEHLSALLDQGPWDLVSVAHANNETGVIQPTAEIATLCQAAEVPLHLDCAQSLGKLPIDLRSMKAAYATFSSHKIGAPKGVGFLVVPDSSRILCPLIHGKQQHALRGGTENSFGVALTGRALEILSKNNSLVTPQKLAHWQRDFEMELKRRIPGTVIHGETAPRLPNTSFVGFAGIDGDGIIINLDREGIHVSAGSACSSGNLNPSHVLLAMGCSEAMARSSVRFSSGPGTSWPDFERVLEILPEIVQRTRVARES